MPITIKIKAKRRPLWGYVVVAILSLPISAFWAWVAHSVIGFSPTLARQVFIVFGALSLAFPPSLYLANEKQVRDRRSKAIPVTATAFLSTFAAAVLYFVAKHDNDIVLPVVYGAIVISLGAFLSLFAIRYEAE